MRGFITFVFIALVIGLAGSWLLGWWDVSTDKEKMKQDIDRAKNKIQGVHQLKGKDLEKRALCQGQTIGGISCASWPFAKSC